MTMGIGSTKTVVMRSAKLKKDGVVSKIQLASGTTLRMCIIVSQNPQNALKLVGMDLLEG